MLHSVLLPALIFALIYLSWLNGKYVSKVFDFKEDSKLLSILININIGLSLFLIVLNFTGNFVSKDFNIALIATSFIFIILPLIKIKDLKDTIVEIRNSLPSIDKFLLVILFTINIVYGITAFSTQKLDHIGLNKHIYNVNQLLIGTFPPKYSFSPAIDQKYHHGADILGGVISKFTGLNPELSFDVLTLLFLSLSILTLYALSNKFLNTNSFNKYIVPIFAFFALGPTTNLFSKELLNLSGNNLLENMSIITNQFLTTPAIWSGLVVHWFFAPPVGISIFFFLISLYLLFQLFHGNQNKNFAIFLGILISTFIIIDISKLVLLIVGVLTLLFFSKEGEEIIIQKKFELLKNIGIVFAVLLTLCIIHGNWITINNPNYEPLITFFKIGDSNGLLNQFGPFKTNILFLCFMGAGFYFARKQNLRWVLFILPFYVTSLIIPYFITVPEDSSGKIFLSGNIIGAFVFPLFFEFIKSRLKINNKVIYVFYVTITVLVCSQSIMYWAFGDPTKPLFKVENKTIKYTGIQKVPQLEPKTELLIKHLRSVASKNQSITTKPDLLEVISENTGLSIPIAPIDSFSAVPVKKEIISNLSSNHRITFSMFKKHWEKERMNWIYITQRVFRYNMPPQARIRFANAFVNNGVNLSYSNDTESTFLISELYKINPKSLSLERPNGFKNKAEQLLHSKINSNYFIKQSILCPYLGIYINSNDFDGDGISDFAFLDQTYKRWITINSKTFEENIVEFNNLLPGQINDFDLLIPVPADYDGDNIADIAIFNRTNAHWYYFTSSDSSLKGPVGWGGLWSQIPIPADIDGDHRCEYSVYDATNPNAPAAWTAILTSTSNPYFNTSLNSTTNDIPLYSDIDADNKADYFIYKPHLASFYIYPSANNFKEIKLMIGSELSRPVLADYDGDGKTDPAVWSPDTGLWEIVYAKDIFNVLLNVTSSSEDNVVNCKSTIEQGLDEKNNTTCNIEAFKLGSIGDIPLVGDYDGDGKYDPAVLNLGTYRVDIGYSNEQIKTIDFSKYKGLVPASFIGI